MLNLQREQLFLQGSDLLKGPCQSLEVFLLIDCFFVKRPYTLMGSRKLKNALILFEKRKHLSMPIHSLRSNLKIGLNVNEFQTMRHWMKQIRKQGVFVTSIPIRIKIRRRMPRQIRSLIVILKRIPRQTRSRMWMFLLT